MADIEFFDTGYGGREVPTACVPQRTLPQAEPYPVQAPAYAPRAAAASGYPAAAPQQMQAAQPSGYGRPEPAFIEPIYDAPSTAGGAAPGYGGPGYDGHGNDSHGYGAQGYSAPEYPSHAPDPYGYEALGYAPQAHEPQGYGASAHDAGGAHGYTQTDPDYGPKQGGNDDGSRMGTVLNWAGALVSLGLVVGMGVWGWQLATRDITDVPVVRALEGPMRGLPDDPGGMQTPNQGLAVNRIAEGEEAAPVPDQLVIAPPPVDLQDLGIGVSAEEATQETIALVERLGAIGTPLEPLEDAPGIAGFDTDVAAEITNVIEELAAEVATPDVAALVPLQVSPVGVIPASVPGVALSPRPQLRPASITTTAAAALVETTSASASAQATDPGATAGDGVLEIAPTDVPVGTWLVQLGAFESAEVGRREWGRIAGRVPDFLAGRPRIIEETEQGGSRFFRLRAGGFEGIDQARRFCAEIVARGFVCTPIQVR